MRKALNENPVVQAALIGVLAIVGGLMLLMRMGGSDEPAAEAPVAAAPATDSAAAAPAAGAPATDPTAAAPATGTRGARRRGRRPALPERFKAGPGLPADVVDAYDAGDAVVVLVVNDARDRRPAAEDDACRLCSRARARRSSSSTSATSPTTRGSPRASTSTGPRRWSSLRPKALTDGPMPSAVVSYGFRGAAQRRAGARGRAVQGPRRTCPTTRSRDPLPLRLAGAARAAPRR